MSLKVLRNEFRQYDAMKTIRVRSQRFDRVGGYYSNIEFFSFLTRLPVALDSSIVTVRVVHTVKSVLIQNKNTHISL